MKQDGVRRSTVCARELETSKYYNCFCHGSRSALNFLLCVLCHWAHADQFALSSDLNFFWQAFLTKIINTLKEEEIFVEKSHSALVLLLCV